MNPIVSAVLKAGLISPTQLEEMKRISAVIDRTAEVNEPVELDLAAKYVQDALESERYVIMRETNLEVLQQYLQAQRTGILHLNQTDVDVSYGKTPLGEFIIAWTSESIAELMLDEATELQTAEGDRVHFRDVRELFFGEHKAFMVCVPSVQLDG